MTDDYFSDREQGPRPRTDQQLRQRAWGGLVALIGGAITNGGFGSAFPLQCRDGYAIVATDSDAMGPAVCAEIPGLAWPLTPQTTPDTLAALDLVEFCFTRVAKPTEIDYHPYYQHHHLAFDKELGRTEFRNSVNRLFARNQLAYELDASGRIIRLAAPVLMETLAAAAFDTEDPKLDELLKAARTKFLDPDPKVRRDALEKLWDGFERLKTLEPGRDKKARASALIEKAAPETMFRDVLDGEARSLTEIGNGFHIRHSEVNQVETRQRQSCGLPVPSSVCVHVASPRGTVRPIEIHLLSNPLWQR